MFSYRITWSKSPRCERDDDKPEVSILYGLKKWDWNFCIVICDIIFCKKSKLICRLNFDSLVKIKLEYSKLVEISKIEIEPDESFMWLYEC